jgi:hypothetical protein
MAHIPPLHFVPVSLCQSTCAREASLTLCGIQYFATVGRKILQVCFAYFKQIIDIYLVPAFAESEYQLGHLIRQLR